MTSEEIQQQLNQLQEKKWPSIMLTVCSGLCIAGIIDTFIAKITMNQIAFLFLIVVSFFALSSSIVAIFGEKQNSNIRKEHTRLTVELESERNRFAKALEEAYEEERTILLANVIKTIPDEYQERLLLQLPRVRRYMVSEEAER